jgi:hypothetical protein
MMEKQTNFVVKKVNDLSSFKHGVIDILLELMNYYETFSDLTGNEKKEQVLESLRLKLGHEIFERYEPLFELIIEFIISLSKKHIKIALNKTKKLFKCCQ